MKFNKSWLAYIGVGVIGIGVMAFIAYKKKKGSMGLLGTENIIGTGGIDNSPTQDTSKSTRIVEALVTPHDSYSSILDRKIITAYDGIDSSWIVNL